MDTTIVDAVKVRCLLISVSIVLMDADNRQLSFEEAFTVAGSAEEATDAILDYAREELLTAYQALPKNGGAFEARTLTRGQARCALESILRIPRLQKRFGAHDVLP